MCVDKSELRIQKEVCSWMRRSKILFGSDYLQEAFHGFFPTYPAFRFLAYLPEGGSVLGQPVAVVLHE